MTIASAALLLFLILDPLGNIPVFLSLLRGLPPRRQRIVLAFEASGLGREAYATLVMGRDETVIAITAKSNMDKPATHSSGKRLPHASDIVIDSGAPVEDAIVAMFALKGADVLALPLDALRIATPLALYFVLMFGLSFVLGRWLGADYPRTTAVAFTSAGNNFELAIAVAIASFGLASPVAFATLIGPVVEVPVLLALATLALRLRGRLFRA